MSFFLPDTNRNKRTDQRKYHIVGGKAYPIHQEPKKKIRVDYYSGLPIAEQPPRREYEYGSPYQPPIPRSQPIRSKKTRLQHRPEPRQQKPQEVIQGFRETYQMGKDIYNTFSRKNKYLNEPNDYKETIERAKHIKKMEREATEYHKARREIEDFEQRRAEYEASQPKKNRFNFLRR